MSGNVRGVIGRSKSSRALRDAVRRRAGAAVARVDMLIAQAGVHQECFPPGPLPGGRTPGGRTPGGRTPVDKTRADELSAPEPRARGPPAAGA